MADLQMLVFELDGQRYGLPLASVREVVRAVWVAPLPSAPAIVEGVVNLRGRPVPVLDLRGRFGVAERAPHPDEHLVVAEVGGRRVAFRVDRAQGLASVAPELLAAAEAVAPGVRHVDRIASDDAGVIFVHDPAAFLSAAESVALDAALGAGA
jgi:purine-binding chemotaxis protein CheW